ncbi:MAG: IclR family transcriptional regulator [Terriglobia bacterium]
MALKENYTVPSIARALDVLELIAASNGGRSVTEMSRGLEIPMSSTDLIAKTLERQGYLQRGAHSGKYCIGLKLVSLSRRALDSLALREEAKAFLHTLMAQTGLTVHMAVLENNGAIIIDKVDRLGLPKLASFVGRRIDSHCTGVGKALIAFMPTEKFEQQIAAKGLAKHNENTIVSINSLRRELARVREVGYALDDEEDELGFRCIGTPIFGDGRKPVAAISVAGTTSQIPIDRVRALGEKLKLSAASISSHLGYT